MDFVQLGLEYEIPALSIFRRNDSLIYLRGTGRHCTNAFPSIPLGHLHIETWLKTSQMALIPHVPGQGSTHLFLRQALSLGQSEFKTHSGRHSTYGSP